MGIFDFFRHKSEPSPPRRVEPDVVSAPTLPDSDIMLLEYCTYGSYPNPKNGYPLMWEREFGIFNVNHALESLESRGYIEFCSALDMLAKFNTAQLKDIAVKNSIAVKGKKSDILAAVSEIPTDALERTVTERKYCVTEKGRQALKENEHIVFAYKNPWTGLSPEEIKALVSSQPNSPYRDSIWAEFNRRLIECMQFGRWNEYRNITLSMYWFLMQENHTRHAFDCLAEVFFYDINSSSPYIAPGLVKEVQKYVAECNCSKEDLFDIIADHAHGLVVPYNVMSANDLAGIITLLAFHEYEAAEEILQRDYPEVNLAFFEKLK